MHELEEKIRIRAYEIWEREGGNGAAEEHWYAAEQEIHVELTTALEVDVTLAAPPEPKTQRRAEPPVPAAAPKRAAKTGESKTAAAKSGATKSGATKSSATKSSAAEASTAKSSTPKTRTRKSGTPTS